MHVLTSKNTLMKKIITLILGLGLLVGLGIYTSKLLTKKGTSEENLAAFNFAIEDTTSIDKVIITDPSGKDFTIIRNNNVWTDEKGGCIQHEMVNNILDAAYNIRFKGYVPENSMTTVINRITTMGKKVQFFVNGSWAKTWYIGGAIPDHHGSYMLVESEEGGKSDLPVICEIKGVYGIIDPRFVSDPLQWQCSNIFAYESHEISAVSIKYTEHPERSFSIRKINKNFEVTYAGKKLPELDTSMVFRYLVNFKKVNFETPNYELSKKQIDSLKKSTPFCYLKITDNKQKTTSLRLFRKASDGTEKINEFGDKVTYDTSRFWLETPSGEIVTCQYFAFSRILMGQFYFDPFRKLTK